MRQINREETLKKTDRRRVSVMLVVPGRGLSAFHSDRSQLGTALLDGLQEETEEPDKHRKMFMLRVFAPGMLSFALDCRDFAHTWFPCSAGSAWATAACRRCSGPGAGSGK